MITTEQQAKTKWCPAARMSVQMKHLGNYGLYNPSSPSFNIIKAEGMDIVYLKCIGSECMMWEAVHGDILKGKCGLSREEVK